MGYDAKAEGVLSGVDFYGRLIAFNRHMAEVGFVREAHQGILMSEPDLDLLLARMAAHEAVVPIVGMKAADL
mgnify:CR=1 FL=1